MNRMDRVSLFGTLKDELYGYNSSDVENGVMCYALEKMNKPYKTYESNEALAVRNILKKHSLSTDIETIIEFFESLLNADAKVENGIVFTPKYIADYVVASVVLTNAWDETKRFIDPGCGGGILLVSAAEMLHKDYDMDIDTIIEKYIFGIDIEKDNARRCILALRLLSAKYNGNFDIITCDVHCCDSLRVTWSSEFNVDRFAYIIGNPPYVNPHDLKPETVSFLKKTFRTTKTGVFNIFYAFIEHAMENIADNGVLGYIVPNNFLTIKSACSLRTYIQENKYLHRILDFGDNMVFKPVRTYNCIIILTKEENASFDYFVMEKQDNIETLISQIDFCSKEIDHLVSNGWKLVDEHTGRNLKKIERQVISIKPFIRTGIATLRDAVFMVHRDERGYFKSIGFEKIYIEDELVKPIYKIPDLKLYDNISEAERYIIFPYIHADKGYTLIAENELRCKYPLTYEVLLSFKPELDARDKGKPNPQGWYAYGRTQGLNKFGRKLLFPTFANKPKFLYVENEDTLFCNGYGIFENDRIELEVLSKVLNSAVMDYYVSNTSYSIEGGFYCYQKKYIEQFSIPWLTEEQIAAILSLSGDELDRYLWSIYELD